MKLFLCALLFAGFGCSKYSSKEFASGTLTDSQNPRSLATLNYRINDAAIAQHSFSLLNQLLPLRLENFPTAWSALSLEDLLAQLKFLHRKVSPDYEKVHLRKGAVTSELIFTTVSGGRKVVAINGSVTLLSWTTDAGVEITLKQLSSSNWALTSDDLVLLLDTDDKKICDPESCVDL